MVWRMSPYERRRGGNSPPGGLRGRPGADNARSGQRGSGHSAATSVGTRQTQSWSLRRLRCGEGAMQTPPRRGEGCASTAVSPHGGRPALTNTVRAEARTGLGKSDRPGSQRGFRKRGQLEHDLHAARAPDFYLDNLMHGSGRGCWKRSLLAHGDGLSPRWGKPPGLRRPGLKTGQATAPAPYFT